MKHAQPQIPLRRLALLALTAELLSGCSGINASKSISPLDFLLPGLHVKTGGTNGVEDCSCAADGAPPFPPARRADRDSLFVKQLGS
jgi:hypothetical protein